jgi:hypothetical protein
MIDTRQEPSFFPTARGAAPPPRRTPSLAPAAVLLLALAIAFAGAAWFWLFRPASEDTPSKVSAPAAAQQAEPAAKAEPPALVLPAAAEMVKPDEIPNALVDLLGREAVLRFLSTTDFPRKAVATLDNLARDHAPVPAWPVVPAPGRFAVAGDGAALDISADNARRYRPFVAFVESIDPAQAVDLYRRMYPVLQQAWRDLGFTNRTLHARLFEVIDVLLATPEPAQPPKVTLVEVKGTVASTQPWTRYEYEDPALQRLTAGQKMLLRMGPDNRKVLKAKLQQVREQLLRVSTETAPR